MLKMRFGTALVWIVLFGFVLSALSRTTCRLTNDTGHIGGPVEIVSQEDTTSGYSERITVRVWMKAEDFCNSPVIQIEVKKRPSTCIRPDWHPKLKQCTKGDKKTKKNCNTPRCIKKGCKKPESSFSHAQWELELCSVEARNTVTVTYNTTTTSYSVNYTVPDPKPNFDLSLNQSSKSIIVTVEPGKPVLVRWCYRKNGGPCMSDSDPQIIHPNQTRAVLKLDYLLPCVCVQAYYTHTDAVRQEKCLQNESLIDVGDIWRSYDVKPFESYFQWISQCPDLNVSASLCWKQSEHLCTPIPDFTLQKKNGPPLIFNTSAVDKHPQMCVQFSLQGSHSVRCYFTTDESSWEVNVGPGTRSIVVFVTSSATAKFSAQLCVLTEGGCAPKGETHTVTVQRKTETSVNIPLSALTETACVQVWQSDPALHGRRILCLDTTHYRHGLYAAAALMFAAAVVFVGMFIHRLTKKGMTGWLHIRRPLLLVCSSDQLTHVSAVCALASILQEDLGAPVHTALWTQSSQEQSETKASVADLGPLPWLYGQWEAICKQHGKVLIFWSPEATEMYEKWREKRGVYKKTDKAAGKKDDCHMQKKPSTVIELVFLAALACLEGALQESRGERAAIVYFQGLGHSRDIPKAFRGVPRYCLPHDFRGLIQELVDIRKRESKTGKYRRPCWPILLSKVLSIWLARQLTQKLQTLLPQSVKKKSDEQQSVLKLSDRSGAVQEQELLCGSPWRAENFSSQVSLTDFCSAGNTIHETRDPVFH